VGIRVSGYRFGIVAVGDLQLGDSPTSVGFGFGSRYDAGQLSDVLDELRPALRDADIVFGNLEVPLSKRGLAANSWSSRQLRGDPAYAEVLKEAGFTVLNVANNHAVQHGVEAFRDSIEALQAAGITPCGIRGTGEWASAPVTLTVDGARVGLLAFCLRPRQYGADEPPYAEGSPDSIRADVRRLRAEVDVVLVSLHWGEEFVPVPSVEETALGRSIIDAGASMIIGHHPHVARPVERHNDGLIAYSLGNCVGDMVWYSPFRRGLIMSAEISDGAVGHATVRATRLGGDYRPALDGEEPVVRAADFEPLEPDAYARAIAETWRKQRIAVYWFALLRVWRVPPQLLFQLVGRTLGNKFRGLIGRAE
jgi:poly-gamma-glutamate synthesis protein (capsule biosynthesis protein)